MNGINNQFINPAITQDSNAALSTTFGESPDFLANSPQDVFQELAGNTNEFEDFFHFSPDGQETPAIPASLEDTGISSLNFPSGIPQELAAIAEKTLDVPLHHDEVGITPPQEIQDVNTAKPSNQEFIQKRKRIWTIEEDERLFELKQRYSYLTWKGIAKYFPEYTNVQLRKRWNKIKPRLVQEGKLIDPNAEDINPIATTRDWSEEENTAKPSNQEFIKKRVSAWTKKEDKRLIELKQKQPELSWSDIAKHFPKYTGRQCLHRWCKIMPPLVQEGKLIDWKAEDLNPIAETKNWSEEENKRFIKLKKQQPKLLWQDFVEYFPGHTVIQCQDHWHSTLKTKLMRKRKLTPDQNWGVKNSLPVIEPRESNLSAPIREDSGTNSASNFLVESTEKPNIFDTPDQNIDNPSNKKLRTTSSNSAIPTTIGEENPNPLTNSSPAIPQKLTEIVIPSLSHTFPIQQTSQDEQKKLLDLSFHQYEEAVHHFQEIRLTDPLLQSIQQETAQSLANTQLTYQVIKQRLTIEASLIPILEQATSLITFCKTSTYYLETVYQHFLSYQANPESKEWFSSQSVVFTSLYCAFLKGNMEEATFRHSLSLKDRDYSYQSLNNLFIHLKHVFKNHSSCFGLEYTKFIDNLFFNIEFQLNLLKYNQQNWMSMASLLKEIVLRMQEIEIFFQSYFNIIPCIETEANIIARLKNEISLQDFYAKQTANDGPKWT